MHMPAFLPYGPHRAKKCLRACSKCAIQIIRAFALLSPIQYYPMNLLADSDGSDQTARKCRLIWAFAVRNWPKTRCATHSRIIITKTYLYNFDPLKPHFYIVKLGFTGVYIIFLISVQNIDCGYSLEPPRRGGSNEYPKSMF